MKTVIIILLCIPAGVACRDASRSPGGPSFSVTTDSGGGGCDAHNCHFNARDESAFLSWSDPGTSVPPGDTGGSGSGVRVFGFLTVYRAESQTFLSYSVYECPSWGCVTVRGGYGPIPNEDFTGTMKSMRLSTNTTGNPDFFTYAGSTGPVSTTWTANGLYETHNNGSIREIQPGLTSLRNGQIDAFSAEATGTIVSYNIFPGNSAQISKTRNVTVVITRE